MNNEYKNEIAYEKERLAIKRRYRSYQRYEHVQNEWFYCVDKPYTGNPLNIFGISATLGGDGLESMRNLGLNF